MSTITLEEYTCRTWPALETIPYDGWLLRFADGCTNRANAVYPLYRSTYDIERKIAFVEQEYTARGLVPTFKITDAVIPPALDSTLAAAGYVLHEPSFVMSTALTDTPPAPDSPAKLAADFHDSWLDAYFDFQPSRSSQRDAYCRILTSPTGQRAYGTVEADGRIVAVGLGSRSRDHVGIYNMATHPDYRGRGYAGAIVGALLAHAYAYGARSASLSVLQTNEVAQRVYRRHGFEVAYAYHYRKRV